MGIYDPILERLLIWGCSKEMKAEIELVEQLFQEFKTVLLNDQDFYDCVAGLSYSETLIELLEQAGVPDTLPLLKAIRAYMGRFLPTYAKVVADMSRSLPGHPYSTAEE